MGGKSNLPVSAKLFHLALVLTLTAGIFFAGMPAQIVQAGADIIVNSTLDRLSNDGSCTLREAVISANKNAPSGSKPNECPAGSRVDTDRILLPNNLGPFVLTRMDNGKEDSGSSGDLDMLGSLTIEAGGPGVVIEGGQGDRVFHVLSGSVTLRQLTIKNSNHSGDGGGIFNKATLSLDRVTLAGNKAGGSGGGLYNATGASLTVTNSTFSGNTAGGSGGGLFNLGTALLNNVTISANVADANKDGNGDGGGATGAAGATGKLRISNTIIGGNSDLSPANQSPNCSGSLESGGFNLIQNLAGCTLSGDSNGNLTGVDPLLGPLQDNGGGILTHALVVGSQAIDAGNPSTCELTDQRGTSRPQGKACDIGAVEAAQNAPVLIRAFSEASTTTVVGRLDSAPNTTFTLQLLTGSDPVVLCSGTGIGSPVGSPVQVTTDMSGDLIFLSTFDAPVQRGQSVVVTAADPGGFTSSYSRCVRVGAGNDSWPGALELFPQDSPDGRASADDYIDLSGQSRWYKFRVEPGSRVIATLTDLPANYDLTLYKDIDAAFRNDLETAFKSDNPTQDLVQLGAEFASDAFSPDAYAPDAYAPDAYAPDAYAPDAYAPDAYAPDAYAPDAYAPDAYAPDAYAPDAFAPDAYAPDAYAPDAYAPDAYAPDAYAPDAYAPDAYASAQTRSLIAISAFDGQVSEGIRINTWDSSGYFYARVRGRNGAFDIGQPFHLEVRQVAGACSNVNPAILPQSDLSASGPDFKTIILTNLGRMLGTDDMPVTEAEKQALSDGLQALAIQPEVAGVVVDVSQDARVAAAYDQFDAYDSCPSAGNLVAEAIKGIVDKYWQANPGLEYVVIVGNDAVIPFFRHADHAMLATEKNYSPPVLDNSTSQASLKLGYVLSQDDYGARTSISLKDDQFPIPSLAVGRLVETPSDSLAVLNAYLSPSYGSVITPTTALVTGYDFLADVANEVDAALLAGLGSNGSVDSLIAPREQAPTDPNAWTADDLRAALLGQRHDLIFLAGHFSADSALAADYTTRLTADEVVASTVVLTNTVIYSVGCHAGYNIVNPHGVPGVTRQPDWAQAFASKGATLIAGTGYQYGDTDFIKYSERLYQLFTQQLRTGSGAVPIGKALVAAKQAYLAENIYLRGIDEKSVLEATLFGLPMLRVNLPEGRITPPSEPSKVTALNAYAANPGAFLGLQYADVTLTPAMTPKTVQLDNIHSTATATATYLQGPDGVVSKPNEPVMPLETDNVSFPGTVLRGVGFREGDYTDSFDVLVLTGASATEVRGVHVPFLTSVFSPARPWMINYFDALANQTDGITQLAVTPAQYISSTPESTTGTLRRYDRMKFRLFYSSNTSTFNGGSTPALAAPPAITQISSSVGATSVTFRTRVVGNPAAGIQEVWVTYTDLSQSPNGQWRSVDLQQNSLDSTLWEGTLLTTSADNIRYMIQATNGVGLVSMDTNQGRYYVPGAEAGPTQPTTLSLIPTAPETQIPAAGRYSTPVTLSAQLASNGIPLEGKTVTFVLGPQSRLATTDDNGVATVTLSIFGLPGENEVSASFAGAGDYQAEYDTKLFAILQQGTKISPNPLSAEGFPQEDSLVSVTLTDVDNRRLGEETLFFIVSGVGGTYSEAVITDYAGQARLGNIPLPPGDYDLEVYFSGSIPREECKSDTTPPLNLTLTDDRYMPTCISGTLTLLKNDAPVATGDAYSLNQNTPLVVTAPGVLGNDSDVDGDALEAFLVSGPSNGSLAFNSDGSFVYTPNIDFFGGDSFAYKASDGELDSDVVTVVLYVTRPSLDSLWPPNGEFVTVSVLGATDPSGVPVSITITGVRQDEPVGSSKDAIILGSTVQLRAERDGNGNGRVYHIFFSLPDGNGGSCAGEVLLGVVPHDQGSDLLPVDDGAIYDSTVATQ